MVPRSEKQFFGSVAPLELEKQRKIYVDISQEFLNQMQLKGICFDEYGKASEGVRGLREKLVGKGVESCYSGASLRRGTISQACLDCVTALRSKTFQISSRCHRSCFFCLNADTPERQGLEKSWKEEMDELREQGISLDHVALSGGEPLLYKEDVYVFFKTAREYFPKAWKRLYTSGDLLRPGDLERLATAGLDEIRFSFKQDDPHEVQQMLLDKVSEARASLSFVAVEMPVLPGTFEYMKNLLGELDGRGVDSINLLEFCFPFCNWGEFEKRGYVIKNPPFEVLYNYDYAGGLPIAGSEYECLRLLDFACDEKLQMGMHYCSLANKHRAQIFAANVENAENFPEFDFDSTDFFLKTCKVFGGEIMQAQNLLDSIGQTYTIGGAGVFLQCNPSLKPLLEEQGLHVAISSCVMEKRGGNRVLRELALQ